MKKIYMIMAAIALLSLSLNAQDGNQKESTGIRLKARTQTVKDAQAQAPSMNELLNGIKGMSSVLQATQDPNGTSGKGQSRAPLKINSGEELLGPYTTNDFSTSGLGFPDVYGGNSQQAYIFSDLNRSDFIDFDGREIIGFRLALAGNSSQKAIVYDFMAWPYSNNGYFENANRHTWSLPAVAGSDLIVGDISIEVDNGFVGFKSITVYSGNSVITQWVGTTNTTTVPSGWSFEGGSKFASNGDGSYYMTYGGSGGGILTISSGLFTGYTNVRLVINAAVDSGTGSENYQIVVNNSPKTVTNENPTFVDFEWSFSADSMPVYLELEGGQWHEFYLDEPVTFHVNDTIAGMYLGYNYWQFGSSSTGEFMYPIAVNPNSTGHNNYSYMTKQNGTTTVYDNIQINANTYARINSITVRDGNNNTITSFSYNTDGGTLPSGWGLSGSWSVDNSGFLYPSSTSDYILISGDLLQGRSNVSVVINFKSSTRNRTATVYVNNSGKSTTSTTASNQTWSITGTSGPAYYSGWWTESLNGDLAVQLIFADDNKTPKPVITYTSDGENVTITATGNGTVTLSVDGGEPVSDEGSVSIVVPCGPTSTTVTATATAKEEDMAESDPTIEQVPIPAGTGWTQMDGTYNDPHDLLTFTLNGEKIMLIDQFLASTLHNDQLDGYTYVMKETVDGEVLSSNPVTISVYKTSSTMQGCYTQSQVDDDVKMQLKSEVLNSAMYYDVHPDDYTLYYSLYRGELNSDYPVIDIPHRVSQLQRFDEMDENEHVHYYFNENHTSGVVPDYDKIGTQIVERLDTNYVQGSYGQELSYVPVIWTLGQYTGRKDGKNNSYGSDIKREKLGKAEIIQVGGSMSGGNNAENTGNGWEGYFTHNGVQYCIYTPIITVEGTLPDNYTQGDYDLSEYEPYMYRVWCLYDGAINFDQNAQGILVGGDPIKAPFLLGQEIVTDPNVNRVSIGRNWQAGQPRVQNSFAVPRSVSPSDVQFAARFYYKKKVTNAQAANTLRANREGGEENEYYIAEGSENGNTIPVSVDEFIVERTITGVTYVNAQGMTSDKPFDGMNIIVTKYSDGTTTTTKVMR